MTHYHKTESGLLVPFAPHILKRNAIEGEVSNKATMQGLYKLTVRRADGSVKQETPWFENLILDTGLEQLGTSTATGSLGPCEIGTGTAVPSVSQTQLQSFSARTTNAIAAGQSAQATSPYYYSAWRTWRFAIGTLNGNYTEVGVGWDSNNLFSRALITPDGVTPAAITVLSDEQLDVSYTMRVYPPSESDWGAGTFDISGASYDVFGRLSQAATNTGYHVLQGSNPIAPTALSGNRIRWYAGTVGAITGAPSGANNPVFSDTLAAYTPGSLSRNSTANFGLSDGNTAGGIRSVVVQPNGFMYSCQYQFTPAIPKDDTKTLSLTFSCSWARRP